MRHLFNSWNTLKRNLAERPLYLFLDYDGTLSPIARDPDKAVLSLRMRRSLGMLSESDYCRIAVISGRALSDIRKRVGIAGIIYGGNHGLEIEGPEVDYRYPVPEKARIAIEDLGVILRKVRFPEPGAVVEDKGLSLTVHFRNMKHGDLLTAAHVLSETILPYRIRGEIVMNPGKESFEIKPSVEWNKGKTARWLLEKRTTAGGKKYWPICAGEDRNTRLNSSHQKNSYAVFCLNKKR